MPMPNSVMINCGTILFNKTLTTVQKVDMIKQEFRNSAEIHLDEKTGRYYYLTRKGTKKFAVNGSGGPFSKSLLLMAVEASEFDIVKWLIEEQSADIALDAVCYAIQEGHIEILRYLISQGLDVNATYEKTLLDAAVCHGQLEAAYILIENEAFIKEDTIQNGHTVLNSLRNMRLNFTKQFLNNSTITIPTKMPSIVHVKEIVALLETRFKFQSFIMCANHAESPHVSKSFTKEEHKASFEFMHLINASHKVINRLKENSQMPTDCKIRILSFLYGNFDKHQDVSSKIANILDPKNPEETKVQQERCAAPVAQSQSTVNWVQQSVMKSQKPEGEAVSDSEPAAVTIRFGTSTPTEDNPKQRKARGTKSKCLLS